MKTASGRRPGEWKTRPYCKAECETRGCDWKLEKRNARAEGKKHAKESKHCVVVLVDYDHIYNYEEK